MINRNLLSFLKKIRSIGTCYIANQTSTHLEHIRRHELSVVCNVFQRKGRLLEIGAGTGWQAKALQELGYDVSAIDLSTSNLKNDRIWPITDYDGKTIPFENNSFDIVYSSNVLEHIEHYSEFQKEIHRVLKKNGVVIHVLPSSSWRWWSNITEILKKWRLPLIHGAHAQNAFSEIYYFSRWSWVRRFRKENWKIDHIYSIGLFYTGSSIMDNRLEIKKRIILSKILGSACNIFILRDNLETRK